MADIYQQLAERLDQLPHGYPATDSGVELKILQMLEQANSLRVMDCICRKERSISGHQRDHSLELCLSFSGEKGAYDYFSRSGRIISKAEAFQIIDQAEEEGLIHNVFYNTQEGHGAVCNCCACCCGVIRAAKEYGAAHTLAKSNYLALIDPAECIACGDCAHERCQMDAISVDDDVYTVINDLCIGCAVCTIACPTDAISLVERPQADQDEPPVDFEDWSMKRASNRGIEFKG